MLLAASRTSFQFFLSGFMSANKFLAQYISMGSIQVYAAIEAILSVLGIEGLLVGLGVADGYKRGESIINRNTITFIAIGISVFAGLGQGIEAATDLPAGFAKVIEAALVLITGVGVPFLAYLGAQVYGATRKQIEVAYIDWMDKANASWASSKDRQLATRQLRRRLKEPDEIPASNPQVQHQIASNPQTQHQIPAEVDWKAPAVLAWYRTQKGLHSTDTNMSAADVAKAAAEASGVSVDQLQINKLQGALRTQLYRERQSLMKNENDGFRNS